MNFFRKYRVVKIAGIVVLLGSVLVIGASQYFSGHYKRMIQARLPALVAKATDSLYQVSIGDFKLHVIGRSVSVFGLHLWPDTVVVNRRRKEGKLPGNLLDITVPEIEIAGLKLGDFTKAQAIVCRTADIYHPVINVTLTDSAASAHRRDKTTEKPGLQRVFINSLNIIDPTVRLALSEGEDAGVVQLKGGSLALKEWDFYPGRAADTTRFLYAKEADIELYKVAFQQPGMLYAFGADTVSFQSRDHKAYLGGAFIKPSVTQQAFYKEVKVQKEIYQGAFAQVEVTGLAWERFFQGRAFYASAIAFTNPELSIFLSRLLPANTASKVGNYPHQLLQKISFPIEVPTISLYDGGFHYSELNEKTKRAGTLDFTHINGRITGATNNKNEVQNNAHCRILFTGKFMRKSNMGAVFDFPLATTHGAFTVKGKLLELDGSQVSETAKALALAEIKSLKVHQLDFNICGDDHSADGNITLRYNDLKVKIKKVDQQTLQLRNRGFISFVANELLLYNDNPMEGEPVRVATTHVVRDSTKSFFNLIWRNLFEAGIQTAVRQEGITDMVKKRQANKGKEKLHFFRKLFPKRAKKQK